MNIREVLFLFFFWVKICLCTPSESQTSKPSCPPKYWNYWHVSLHPFLNYDFNIRIILKKSSVSRFSSDSEQWHFEVRVQSGCICCGPVAECIREGKGEDPEEEAGSVQLWHRAAAEGLWAANFRQDPGQSEGKGLYIRSDVSVRHLWKLRLDGWLKARGRNSRQDTNR